LLSPHHSIYALSWSHLRWRGRAGRGSISPLPSLLVTHYTSVMKTVKILYILLLLLPVGSYSQETNTSETEVNIFIEHGIMTPSNTPGYLLYIQNWGPSQKIEVYVIDPAGKQLAIIPPDSGVRSGEDGEVSFEIPYVYGDLQPGNCVLILGGPSGVHQKMVEYPTVIAPTEEDPQWHLQFQKQP
jgi:hypothetical protein